MRSIVTSRFESYTEVSLNEKLYKALEVKNFSPVEIADYVRKWYGLEESSSDVRNIEINDCLKQLDHVDHELKCNPLLLSLILILYRNELEIPTSKLEIYENCTTTIVDHRDSKEKKLLFNLKVSNIIGLFSSLAFWQFENDMLKKTVHSDDVLKFIKRTLISKGEYSDDRQATQSAEEFLDFAKVRSIYFENKFTHKTFLEYFTAYYIYSNYFSKPQNQHSLAKIISKNIGLSSWAVVLELLICKIDSVQIDFEIIDSLVEEQLQVESVQPTVFFLGIVRYLKNISPRLCVKLITNAVHKMVSQSITDYEGEEDEELFNQIAALSQIARFKDHILNAFDVLIKQKIESVKNLTIFAWEYYCIFQQK